MVVLGIWSVAACSNAASSGSDSLRGVSEATAARLCTSFFTSADALKSARTASNLDGVDAAADGYQRLAADARAAGAKAFGSNLSDAADAAKAITKSNRDYLAGGQSNASQGTAESIAPSWRVS